MDFFNLYIILFGFAHLPSSISHIKHSAHKKREKRIQNENRLTLLSDRVLRTVLFRMNFADIEGKSR